MILSFTVPDTFKQLEEEWQFFKAFLQGVINRRFVGGFRYGPIKAKQKYLTRLKKELKVYEETGNMEQLLNIATYSYLEAYAPENKKFHWNPSAESATRKEMGGHIA